MRIEGLLDVAQHPTLTTMAGRSAAPYIVGKHLAPWRITLCVAKRAAINLIEIGLLTAIGPLQLSRESHNFNPTYLYPKCSYSGIRSYSGLVLP